MAVVRMKHFSLYASETLKAPLLKQLQLFGKVQFRDLEELSEEDSGGLITKDTPGENAAYYENELASVRSALTQLARYKGADEASEPMDIDDYESAMQNYDYHAVLDKLKAIDEASAQAKADISKLASDNDNLRNYQKLDIDVSELPRLRYAKAVTGNISKSAYDAFEQKLTEAFPESYVEAVSEIKEEYVLLIFATAETIDDVQAFARENGFSRSTLAFEGIPKDTYKENQTKIDALKDRQKELEEEKAALGGEYSKLSAVAEYFESMLSRETVTGRFLRTNSTLLTEGWVPQKEYDGFIATVEKVCGDDYYIEAEDVDEEASQVPITLKNNKLVSAFESITEMYSLPQYGEPDPTPALSFFYMLIFGLMLGDSGYGLVIMCACGYMIFKNPNVSSFIKFFFWLGVSTFICGFLYGSFFGFTFFAPIKTDLIADYPSGYKPILSYSTDIVKLLIYSVGVGVIQIIFGIGVKGYSNLKHGRPWSAVFDSLFFILVILAGVGLVLNITGSMPLFGLTQAQMGKILLYLLYAMMIGIALTAGRSSPSIGGKIGNGLYTVYGLTSYVGDFISYTRIAALMLSGAYISFSFNNMASLVWNAGILGKVFGVIISAAGNVLNFGLSALGAYVHTCRLHYVEYFGKFYDGGGMKYEPFKMQNKSISLK